MRILDINQIDRDTAKAEEDVANGRVTSYSSYEDYRKAMDSEKN